LTISCKIGTSVILLQHITSLAFEHIPILIYWQINNLNYYLTKFIINNNSYINNNGDWGLGIGDWGLGVGVWGLGYWVLGPPPNPNPQSPIPNPQSPTFNELIIN
jgi:hypothetical protein